MGLASLAIPARWQADADLLQRVAAGDTRATRVLVDRLLPQAHAMAWRLTGSTAEAEDIVQEAFCRMWQRADSFEVRAQVSTWFLAIVRNLSIDRLRRREEALDDGLLDSVPDEAAGVEQQLIERDGEARLRAALQRLPARQRAALVLWAWHDHDVPAIARAFGIADNAAHQLLFRAKRSLRSLLMEEDDERVAG